MVTLPPDFIATKYPGYFWHYKKRHLYSLKCSGILRPLKRIRANHFNKLLKRGSAYGYHVSVNGQRCWLTEKYLNTLIPTDSIIPSI